LQSDSLSALLISAYPAAMFLASALRSGHHPRENIQNDQIGLDLQGDECFDCCEEPAWRGGSSENAWMRCLSSEPTYEKSTQAPNYRIITQELVNF
jgi:hypothetical protein